MHPQDHEEVAVGQRSKMLVEDDGGDVLNARYFGHTGGQGLDTQPDFVPNVQIFKENCVMQKELHGGQLDQELNEIHASIRPQRNQKSYVVASPRQ